MFGSKKREAERDRQITKAAERASSRRSNFDDALREVLSATHTTTLHVSDLEISGSGGNCSITVAIQRAGSAGSTITLMEGLQKSLGRRYSVTACFNLTVVRPSSGLAMDLASGYSIPRLYAVKHDRKVLEVSSRQQFVQHRRELRKVNLAYVAVRRKNVKRK